MQILPNQIRHSLAALPARASIVASESALTRAAEGALGGALGGTAAGAGIAASTTAAATGTAAAAGGAAAIVAIAAGGVVTTAIAGVGSISIGVVAGAITGAIGGAYVIITGGTAAEGLAIAAIAGATGGAIARAPRVSRQNAELQQNTDSDQQSMTIFEQLQSENGKIEAIHDTLNILDKKESYIDPISQDEIKFDTEKKKWILNLGNEMKEIEKGSWIAYFTKSGNAKCKVAMTTISLITLKISNSAVKCPITRNPIPNETLKKIELNREELTSIPILTTDMERYVFNRILSIWNRQQLESMNSERYPIRLNNVAEQLEEIV